ncbi:MAG: lipoprotein-releasing ABC transporter permease subunit [Nitrospirae bacterium]|nr:lipoprotein-releasing ABC transporter permease subunit [Nitrospirota bacterium]
MNLPYQFFIALRYSRAKKKHKGISINTFISIAGVALGVMALIIVLSVMGGFHEDLQKKILGANAHIVALNFQGKMKDHDLIQAKINAVPGVKHSSPFIFGQVMLSYGERAYGIIVRGVDPDLEKSTTDIIRHIKEGGISGLNNRTEIPGIIVGRELARNLGLLVGDEVRMLSPTGEICPLGMMPRIKKFKVAGIFEIGMYEYDSNLAIINIKDAQEFFRLGDEITGFEIKVDDIFNAVKIAEDIGTALGASYYARDWMQMNRNLFSALKLEKLAMFIILVLIVLVASFNIISNLIMIVIEKAREIAIMRAMGATSRGVMSIFMIHGLIIGVIGTLIGLAGGYIVCYLLKTYRFISLPPDIYYLSYLPVKMSLFDFVAVPVTAVLISFIATLYPSWQAARMNPVEPLRYE